MGGIILVRHAATAWTRHRYCGRSDPPLSPAGRAAAARLAGELAPTLAPGTRIVTSPSRRSHATATAIAAAAGLAEFTIDDRWREANFGIAEGLTFDALARIAPDFARRLADGETEIDWPEGERAAELSARVVAAWRALVDAGDDVVVVTHAGPLRIAIGLATGRSPGELDLPGPGAVIRPVLIPPSIPGQVGP
jgi:broad specificity phosphatase PhoE